MTARRRRARPLAAATCPAATRCATSPSPPSAGQIVGVLGPNGGGKTTLFRALLGELPIRRGEIELPGRPAYVPQTERARLDFPVSAFDVVLMGAYARTPWFRRVARARPRRRARGAGARRARRTRPTRASARSPAASASAC